MALLRSAVVAVVTERKGGRRGIFREHVKYRVTSGESSHVRVDINLTPGVRVPWANRPRGWRRGGVDAEEGRRKKE